MAEQKDIWAALDAYEKEYGTKAKKPVAKKKKKKKQSTGLLARAKRAIGNRDKYLQDLIDKGLKK